MTDAAGAADPTESGTEQEPLVALRTLLLSPEQRQIARLQRRLDDPNLLAEDVSRVIAEAIVLRAARDEDLRRALAPLISEVLRDAVKRDPAPVADAVSPVIGPAVRRAVRDALSQMVQSLNRALAHSLSLRAIRWRIEAWRTGRPFAEVVLLNTLVYRVEQVMLIDRETGLLLLHVSADGVEGTDGDVVAGMLTATGDLMSEAFGASPEHGVRTLEVGDLSVWTEQGPRAAIAAVVRGTAPEGLRRTLREGLEAVHLRFGGDLERYSGDAEPFEAANEILRSCLEAEYR